MAGVFFVVCLFTKRIHGVSYDICAIVMLCLFVSGSIMTTTQRSFLTLRSRSDSPSFWEKYRDDFFKQAITSVIAGIIGYLAGHFLK